MVDIQPRQYYTEFHPEASITQPWNAWSSVLFLLPVVFWLIRLRGEYKPYFMLVAILPLAVVNGVGSFLWHAHSGGALYLKLDTYPPRIMLAFLGVYFLRLVTRNWLVGLILFVAFAALVLEYKEQARPLLNVSWVTFNYIFNALIVIVPALLVLVLYRGRGWGYFLLTVLCLVGAVWFRMLDGQRPLPELMPQGTHFLWHLLCALAYLPLGYYLIRLEDAYRQKRKVTKVSAA